MKARSQPIVSATDKTPAVRRLRWPALAWLGVLTLALALVLMVRTDLVQLRWVSELSLQGSPPPARDPGSPTGYASGLRHFLGAQERGETYRWIAAVQEFAASGPFASTTYTGDTVPTGRPLLLPRLYAGWVCAIAWTHHFLTGDPFPLSVERAALWEPLVSHVLAFAAAVWFMGRRHGLAAAAVTAVFFAWFPPLAGQFLPGVLTARTWALLLAAIAIATHLPRSGGNQPPRLLSARSAVAAGASLWLDPAFGFPAVLICAAAGATAIMTQKTHLPCLRWSFIGAALTFAGWLIDRAPWDSAAGELRYVHPLYAFAWIGLGLALDASQHLQPSAARRKLRLLELAVAVPLLAALAYVQFSHAFKGWLYPSVWIRRISSLDESPAFETAFNWVARASVAEILLLSAPVVVASVLLTLAALRDRRAARQLIPPALTLGAVVLFSIFRLRWGVVAVLVALPVIWHHATQGSVLQRRILAAITAVFLLGLAAWNVSLPPSQRRASAERAPSAADLEALIHRHFAHWLAAHSPPGSIAALAPPELADSLVFHGGGRVLMSTAWESYPGQLAATRILSALEATESEAVVEGHGLTHVVLPSWDKVLPLFVRKPAGEPREPLYDRLQRWLHPAYFRPLPYRLSGLPAFAAENLTVFKVIPPDDEALSFSRLAEYFVEMERAEPAALVGRVLADSFPLDPNAAIARATVYAFAKRTADLNRELDRIAADIAAGRTPFSWDRRVQRAIVLALGRRTELARQEVKACLASASRDELYDLTPLQAYRLGTLAKRFRMTLPTPELAGILATLSSELSAAPAGAEADR